MYEENEKKVDWGNIIKRLLMLLIALLVIFGIITLVTKCANSNKNKGNDEPISLSEQLDALQNATLNYLTKDNLPTELNASKTIRLKYLISKNLIEEIKDSEGNTCDENTSYSEVTKLANNYAVKLTLSCGDNSEYRIIYVGCFENCEGGICLGEENSTGGVCDVTVPEPTPTEEPSTNTTTNTNTSTNTSTTKPSTSTTTKPSTNTNTTTKPSTSTTTKPSTNTNSGSNSNSNTNTTTSQLMYQYKRCTTNYYCTDGQLSGNSCVIIRNQTYTAPAIKVGGVTTTNYSCPSGYTKSGTTCKKTTSQSLSSWSAGTTVYLSSTSKAVNTNLVKYTYIKYTSAGYQFKKQTRYYYCASGTASGSSCVSTINATATKTTTPVSYSCSNSSYKYNSTTGLCSVTKATQYYSDPKQSSSCEYTWSYATSLSGWTRTGVTK